MHAKYRRRIAGAVIALLVLGVGIIGLARVLASPPAQDLGPGIVVDRSATAPPVGTPTGPGTEPTGTPSSGASTAPSGGAPPGPPTSPDPSTTRPSPTHASLHPRAPVTPLPPSDPDDDDDDGDDDGADD